MYSRICISFDGIWCRSGGNGVSGIVSVARGTWGVERVRIWRGQWQAVSEPVHEIRVGDEQCSEGDRVGGTGGYGGRGAVTVANLFLFFLLA